LGLKGIHKYRRKIGKIKMNECPIAANAAIKHKGRQYNV
jgi:hypothetical protein